MRGSLLAGLASLTVGLSVACAEAGAEALRRGDRLLGEGDFEAAVAEYKLASRQAGESAPVLQRLANAYATRGEVEEAVRYYEALLERDSSYRYQAAADLSAVARRAAARGARESMARALQPLRALGVGAIPTDLRLALARYHWRDTDYARALPLYLSFLEDADSVPPAVHFETGRAYEELLGCREAIRHFEPFLEGAARRAAEVQSARWHYGNCLFAVADEERAAGRPATALERLDRMVALGVPQTLLDRAHFTRGDLLFALGRSQEALRAYEEVLRLNPSRTGLLVRRAEERIRDIRYGSAAR